MPLTGQQLVRAFHGSPCLQKVLPSKAKGRSTSSREWLVRQLNDPYVRKARYQSYRARSAFKLIEMDDKHKILAPGMVAVECGAAPGGWTQVLVERLGLQPRLVPQETSIASLGQEGPPKVHLKGRGMVIAVDVNPMNPVDGAHVLSNTDFTKSLNQGKILSLLDGRLADLVCSDMAPNATGLQSFDHEIIITLCYSALRFALPILRPKSGAFLTKIWDGNNTKHLVIVLKKFFASVKTLKPPASRVDSSESYILATNFKGIRC